MEKTSEIGNLVLTRENKKNNTGDGMENNNNLFAGGQGHSEKEIEETAISCSLVFLVFLVSLIIFVAVSILFGTR